MAVNIFVFIIITDYFLLNFTFTGIIIIKMALTADSVVSTESLATMEAVNQLAIRGVTLRQCIGRGTYATVCALLPASNSMFTRFLTYHFVCAGEKSKI